jgi:hypothetical protein
MSRGNGVKRHTRSEFERMTSLELVHRLLACAEAQAG